MTGKRCIAAVVATATLPGPPTLPLPSEPIPSVNIPPAPTYIGAPATPAPIDGVAPIPRNSFMAANGDSEIHDDGWQSDIYTWGGPLGRSPQTFSNYLPPRARLRLDHVRQPWPPAPLISGGGWCSPMRARSGTSPPLTVRQSWATHCTAGRCRSRRLTQRGSSSLIGSV